ncbi:hypothetical protein [Prochlorococcus marinus]|uniref:Uncharacterized protein n=1 Tax=Prochlorococcus marinus (strain MIT 9211) TaxID=93059 RepID=A9BED2_PROM4|nr:hypothetical protein [Prochlorococcus marinus]ABX08442.1 Hypothetical protein P9211_05111 [Prochlorococcus marinus str. MIT 9211]
MDSESTSVRHSYQTESSPLANAGDLTEVDDDDPYSWNGTSNALFGLAIAIVSIGVPLSVVVIDQPSANDETIPTALEPYGSKPYPSFSIKRFSKPGS